jgi:ornithine cyclodeaminase/alanine dehydrogenase-like protein (mu-crystallin family)
MSLTIIDASAVRALLPMPACIAAMRDAMVCLSHGQVVLPARIAAGLADGSGYLITMPGSSSSPAIDGLKVLTWLPANPAAGRAAIQGVVLLFDHSTGAPVALVDGAEITAIRTAAVSALATQLLARSDVKSHGILGTGVQARIHIDAVQVVRPGIESIRVWGRDMERTRTFATEQRVRTGLNVLAVEQAMDAASCDVVSTTTGATQPVLQGAWVQPGAHVNLVGAYRPADREADTELIVRSAVYVDLMQSAMNEAGDLLIPIKEGAFAKERIVGELGQLAAGDIAGRSDPKQITVFKSLGVVAQDLFAAWAVYQSAQRQAKGVVVDF